MNGGSPHRRLLAVAAAGLLLAACSSTSAEPPTPSPSPSPPATSQAPPPSPSASASGFVPPSPSAPAGQYPEGRGPSGDPPMLVDGTWLAGQDMPAGVWRTILDEDLNCTYTVLDAAGALAETGTSQGHSVALRLQDGDLFTSENCVVWNYLGTSYGTSTGPAVPGFDITKDTGDPAISGSYRVGRSLPAGHYKLVDPYAGPCEVSIKYEARRGTDLPGGDIFTTLEFSSSDYTARTVPEMLFDLDRGAIFEADGCGAWQRYKYSFE